MILKIRILLPKRRRGRFYKITCERGESTSGSLGGEDNKTGLVAQREERKREKRERERDKNFGRVPTRKIRKNEIR